MRHAIEVHKRRIPLRLVALDALGTVLAAAGVLDLLDTQLQLLPAALRLPGVGVVLMVVGCALMLTVPAWLLRRHRQEHPRESETGNHAE
jgi:hypothetical protein